MSRATPRPDEPRIVALGGGHGLSAAIRAARLLTDDIVAIVSVADDGGSSGRLVRELGIPPPGDARNCLVAMAQDAEMAELFSYRFKAGQLEGHALGNLVLAALADTTGSFTTALDQARHLLHAPGRVVPSTTAPVRLVADVDGVVVAGQSVITESAGIRHMELDPRDVPAHPDALVAIATADLVVVGPGSLYTSVLAVVCVEDIWRALLNTAARRVFVCNLTHEAGETEDVDIEHHMHVLHKHTAAGVVDVMLVNTAPVSMGTPLIPPDAAEIDGVPVVRAALAATEGPALHDSARFAAALRGLLTR